VSVKRGDLAFGVAAAYQQAKEIQPNCSIINRGGYEPTKGTPGLTTLLRVSLAIYLEGFGKVYKKNRGHFSCGTGRD